MYKAVDFFEHIGRAFMGSAILAYFAPIEIRFKVVAILALVDLIFGFFADKGHFHFKKFFKSIIGLGSYLALMCLVYIVGSMQEEEIAALYVVKTISWLFLYFYGRNILRNLRILRPNDKAIAVIYYIFNMEALKKIPGLKEYYDTHPEEQQT